MELSDVYTANLDNNHAGADNLDRLSALTQKAFAFGRAS
jgi:hypothetical protein